MAASSNDGPPDEPLFTKFPSSALSPECSAQLRRRMEFAVRMTCQSCVDAVTKSLEDVEGVRNVYVSLEEEVVLVETSLPSATVQGYLEATGRLVVFRGYGGTGQQVSSTLHHGAAVVILRGEGRVGGLVRMVQVTPDRCVVEGTVDGLAPGQHDIRVHQYGDLSEGCESCGDVYATPNSTLAGHLVSVVATSTGRATFHVVSEQLKVWDIIGRSIVVHSHTDLQSSSQPEKRVMCGIIARSAGLFQNTKKVCTCDGVTIWDEAKIVQQTDLRAVL